jgi:hypothetical protein
VFSVKRRKREGEEVLFWLDAVSEARARREREKMSEKRVV